MASLWSFFLIAVQDREAHNVSDGQQQGGQQRPHLDPSRQNHRVYVGNLSWNVDREQLKQHMSEVGHNVQATPCTSTGEGPHRFLAIFSNPPFEAA